MLDNSLVIYGSPMGNPIQHPLSNVMLSLLHAIGHGELKSFGDSEAALSWE